MRFPTPHPKRAYNVTHVPMCVCLCVLVWFGSLHPSQQVFSHARTALPELN